MPCTHLQGMELLIHLDGYSGPQKDGWKALTELAAASSLVITEEMPTSPCAQWSKVGLPFSATDAPCSLNDTGMYDKVRFVTKLLLGRSVIPACCCMY